jgi:hypothetical protein
MICLKNAKSKAGDQAVRCVSNSVAISPALIDVSATPVKRLPKQCVTYMSLMGLQSLGHGHATILENPSQTHGTDNMSFLKRQIARCKESLL